MKINTNMLDMNIHEMTLNGMKEVLDKHKPIQIRCWCQGDTAYLSMDYTIVMNMTLYSEYRPKEEIIRLLRDTKNLTKTRMLDATHSTLTVDKDSTPYAPFVTLEEESSSSIQSDLFYSPTDYSKPKKINTGEE
jgi:hypothetical protein